MPSRRDIFVNGGIYHIFSKTIDRKIIFNNNDLCSEFLNTASYYQSQTSNIRYSRYKENVLNEEVNLIYNKSPKVYILSYCLMPNHYHLLIKQKQEGGVIRFMANLLNSFTHYYNYINKRKGSLFLTPFRSRKIVSDEQLIHTSRYIHLNPYSAGIVRSYQELIDYPYSSLKEYVKDEKEGICNTDSILKMFNNNKDRYKDFVLGNAEHQRTLEYIKYAKDWL